MCIEGHVLVHVPVIQRFTSLIRELLEQNKYFANYFKVNLYWSVPYLYLRVSNALGIEAGMSRRDITTGHRVLFKG